LAILFFVLRLIFFPNLLEIRFDNDVERGNHVMERLLLQTSSERSQDCSE
jgi:hypothetical protein